MNNDIDTEARARQGYVAMNIARIGGLVLMLAGIAVSQGVSEMPVEFGWALAVGGFVVFFMVPSLLAKKWRSQTPPNDQT